MRDITGIPVYHDLGVPRFVSRYAFDCTGSLGKLRQFSEHGLAASVLSCIFIQISFFIESRLIINRKRCPAASEKPVTKINKSCRVQNFITIG